MIRCSMEKTMKKHITWVLILLLSLACFSACQGESAQSTDSNVTESTASGGETASGSTDTVADDVTSDDSTAAEDTETKDTTSSEEGTDTATEAETAPPNDGVTEEMSLTEALATLGFSGYRTDKLQQMMLYYEYFYVGDIPDTPTVARGMKRLYDEFFAEAIDASDETALTDALLSCYQAAVGDKYAVYLDKEAYIDYNQDYGAEYVGIGVYLSYDRMQDTAQVLSVFENSPAMSAGILPGDYIIAVDDVAVKDVGYYGILDLVRGEVGTSVKITVRRGDQSMDLTMLRQALTSISVTYRKLDQDATVGYIKIEKFDAKTAEQFKAAVDALTAEGVRGLIFDLRNNPGGELNAIVSVLDYLLPDGGALTHFRYSEKSGYATQTFTAGDGHQVDLPMVVLCNEYTASAGELFTSAMRDYEAATVVGVTTYGKGTAQTVLEFGDGTAYTLSMARYDPPFGDNYEGKGVVPHIEVPLSQEAADVNIFLRDDAIDNQLQAAVTELNRLAAQS